MKNILFRKAVALAIEALLAFSSLACASTYKVGEITYANRLSDAKILVAQGRVDCQGYLRKLPAFANSVVLAESRLGNSLAAAQSEATRGSKKDTLIELITKARSLINQAEVLSCSDASSDKKEVVKLLVEAETILGDALAIAQSDAISGPGKPAIATSLASAKTSVGNLAAIAQSNAE
jgi:hypothetical protein